MCLRRKQLSITVDIYQSKLLSLNSLALNSIQIPGAVLNGSDVWLNCDFDILTNATFSVKWYQNNVEFFRIDVMKSMVIDKRYFSQRGVNVNTLTAKERILAKCQTVNLLAPNYQVI
ncbi:hypothetical protein B4U80_03983 [Leptotrombidium deliense]|uniref:Ig-like domain-containing protein n=1 Tax=Leptotrombidium deliense TaxID=299467 RepID=A0A443S4V5_9ACAR|nr:hypothetical protein B4U80_03983 [Leptotrombidium deliense]